VHNTASLGEGEHVDAAKKIIIRARLCSTGCVSALELGNIKTTILSTPADGNRQLHPSDFDLSFKISYLFVVGPFFRVVFSFYIFYSLPPGDPPPNEANEQTLFQVSGGTFLLKLPQLYTLLTTV
jgi:hypothetical protein